MIGRACAHSGEFEGVHRETLLLCRRRGEKHRGVDDRRVACRGGLVGERAHELGRGGRGGWRSVDFVRRDVRRAVVRRFAEPSGGVL